MFRYAVLGLLERAPTHGYDLKQSYDRHFGELQAVKFGQVYSTLSRLERSGRVRFAGEQSGEGPDRKIYAITESGVGEFEGWLLTPDAPEEHVRNVLFAKVVLALLSERPAGPFLEAQRRLHLERMQELTKAKTSAGVVDAALADHRLFHLEADLRWIDATVARLEWLRDEVVT